VPDDAVAALLGEVASAPTESALAELRVADLFLSLACARGDAAALRAFEARTFPGARAALARMGLHAGDVDEVLQIVREKLFVAGPGDEPRILGAVGHGDLDGLVRVAAVRTALNLRRRDPRSVAGDESLCDRLLADGDDPELSTLKEQQRAVLKAAIEDALAGLEARERNILRMNLIHGLSIDEIGRTYQVHRATAARWLDRIRDKLQRESRRLVEERLGVSAPEVDSLVRLVQSGIEVSFARLLDTSGAPSSPARSAQVR
jgi:RNA polymerase sigma-70 factor (ECF subfamily)